MDANEYLERLLAASYAKEIDQEENIFRSLLFAATALAIIFAFMVFVRNDIPNLSIGIYPIGIWFLLALFWTAIALALCFLWLAVARKPLQYLSGSNELYTYVTNLRSYYTASGTPPDQIELRIIEDTRTLMIEQYTLGTNHNQKINEDRLRARTRAFQSLILALILALATAACVLAHRAVRGGGGGGIPVQASG